MNQPIIRQATEADVPIVRRLGVQWQEEDITWGLIAATEAQLRSALGPYFLVAHSDGQIVGFISGARRMSPGLAVIPKDELYLEITDVYIVPEQRSGRVGRALVEAIEQVARDHGMRHALVYSATRQVHRILKFYESAGYQSWYVQLFKRL
jgi:GNAT superfamily N-acetyltransferase